jgi:hypothetical protein
LSAIPLNLIYSAKNLEIKKGKKISWQISLEVLK